MTYEQVQKLTPEEKRIKIAEACGYQWFPSCHCKDQHILALSQEHADTLILGAWIWALAPDYLSDLNAMHMAENLLAYEDADAFEDNLCDIVKRDLKGVENPPHWRFGVCHAIATQ